MTTLHPAAVSRRRRCGRAALLVVLLGAALPLTAQPVFAPAPNPRPATPAAGDATGPATASNAADQPAAGGARPAEIGSRPAFEWGPVALHPSITYRFSYGDGIRARPGLCHAWDRPFCICHVV
jgi:hypothetical protein